MAVSTPITESSHSYSTTQQSHVRVLPLIWSCVRNFAWDEKRQTAWVTSDEAGSRLQVKSGWQHEASKRTLSLSHHGVSVCGAGGSQLCYSAQETDPSRCKMRNVIEVKWTEDPRWDSMWTSRTRPSLWCHAAAHQHDFYMKQVGPTWGSTQMLSSGKILEMNKIKIMFVCFLEFKMQSSVGVTCYKVIY